MTQKTFIERFNDRDDNTMTAEVFFAMDDMGEEMNSQMLRQRRRNNAEIIFSHGDEMTVEEAMELMKQREDDFLEEYGEHDLPEWALRLEAQDVLMNHIYEKFVEGGIIVE